MAYKQQKRSGQRSTKVTAAGPVQSVDDIKKEKKTVHVTVKIRTPDLEIPDLQDRNDLRGACYTHAPAHSSRSAQAQAEADAKVQKMWGCGYIRVSGSDSCFQIKLIWGRPRA